MGENATVTNGARRFRTRRRRFLLVATAALAAVGAAMGISFTADTGTSTVTASAGSTSPLVYKVTNTAPNPLPPTVGSDIVNWGTSSASPTASALAFGTKAAQSTLSTTLSEIKSPSWSPVAGTAGSVANAGDVFVVDGRTASAGGANHITVTVYVTNLANLQAAYSSFAWPVDLYTQWIPSAGSTTIISKGSSVSTFGTGDGTTSATTGGWHVVDSTHPSSTIVGVGNTASFTANSFFLTNTGGYISYYLPTGPDLFYALALDQGGSFYTVNTGTAANLNPTFFVTAQAT